MREVTKMFRDEDLRAYKLREILDVLLAADGEALTVPQIQRRLSRDHYMDLTREEIGAHLSWSQLQPDADGGYYNVHAVNVQRLTQIPGTWSVRPKSASR